MSVSIQCLLPIVFLATVLLTGCTYHKYGRDTHHSVYHLDLSEEERSALETGHEQQKVWYAKAPNGGYDSGLLLITKVPGKKKYHFMHTGKWASMHRVLIQRDSFDTKVEDVYDELGNQVSHTVYLRKLGESDWHLFQQSSVKPDEKHGYVTVLDNYHFNGQRHGHLEWAQPHFHERRSHKHKDHVFLPDRSYYSNEKGEPISREEYNRTVIVWSQPVGRM